MCPYCLVKNVKLKKLNATRKSIKRVKECSVLNSYNMCSPKNYNLNFVFCDIYANQSCTHMCFRKNYNINIVFCDTYVNQSCILTW